MTLMLDWLVGEFEVFGFAVQNWMLLFAGGITFYLVMLAISRRGQRLL
jgi:hypothetical protein